MKKSPLAVVKEQFGSKDKLVDALAGLPAGVLDRSSEDKDAFRQQLLTAANSKLLRLHSVGSDVAKRWGSKAKMVEALATLQNRVKDQDYRIKLSTLTVGKLYDQLTSLERAVKQAQRKAKA